VAAPSVAPDGTIPEATAIVRRLQACITDLEALARKVEGAADRYPYGAAERLGALASTIRKAIR